MQTNTVESRAIETRIAEISSTTATTATTPMAATPAMAMLHTLLDASHGLPPEYRHGLSNHLPMALHALQAMGASPQRMLDFYAGYASRFEAGSESQRTAPVPDWLTLRGAGDRNPEAYPALVASFGQMLARDGELAVLRRVLPELLHGIAAAAFHGVIRTAHAVKAGHSGELAHALAYWAWRWQGLPAVPPMPTSLSFEIWKHRLAEASASERLAAPLISLRMDMAVQTANYRSFGNALGPEPELLKRLTGLALERYLASRNFTVLHMITGLRALRVMLPWIDDVQAFQPLLVRAFVAAYLAAQVRPVEPLRPVAVHSWQSVTEAAIASDDDHVIKLVHACREEFAVYGDPRYLDAAALAIS